MPGGLSIFSPGWKPPSQQQTASQPLNPISMSGGSAYPQQIAQQAQQSGIDPEWQNLLNQSTQYAGQPYYDQWVSAVKSGELKGKPGYEYGPYAELMSGQDKIAKQAEVEKQLAAAQFGKAAEGVQAGMTEAGLAKSGFAGEQLGELAASENLAFTDILSKMKDMQQGHRQTIEDRWRDEKYMDKAENERKKNRKMQMASAGLSTAAGLLKLV